MTQFREIRLKRRPEGLPTADDFETVDIEPPAPASGEVQVRNLYMSVDPYMRARMVDRASYIPPYKIGEALQGGAIGEVMASNDPAFEPGDVVSSMFGWREAFTAPASNVMKIDTLGIPLQAFLGVMGMPGMTAWIGLNQIAQVKAGDVVFVSAASGAVGQIVVQIAKLKGATVVGSAGGAEKCAWVTEIGADAVIDYKSVGDLNVALAKAAPGGIDVYFDNVGGQHLVAALNAARPFARFVLCGMIETLNDTAPRPGPGNLILVVVKRLRLEGFIVSDHYDHLPAFLAEMAAWVKGGKIRWKETIDVGIGAAPSAFLKLFSGENFGKMLVKLR